MSSNSKILLVNLIEYHKSFEKHLAHLTSNFEQLEAYWYNFKLCSEGDYAEQFKSGWIQTEENFRSYINQAQKIKALLGSRIESLSEFNQTFQNEMPGSSRVSVTKLSSLEETDSRIEAKSSKLRRNLGIPERNKILSTNINYPDGDYEAHHIIPGECASKSPLVKAAIQAGFDIDSAENGIYLPGTDGQKTLIEQIAGVNLPKHSGYHKIYSSMIDDILEIHWRDFQDANNFSEFFVAKNFTEMNQRPIEMVLSSIQTIKQLIIDEVLDREDMYKN